MEMKDAENEFVFREGLAENMVHRRDSSHVYGRS